MSKEYNLVQRSALFNGNNIKDVLPITSDLHHVLKGRGYNTDNIFVHVNGEYIPPIELINTIPNSGDIVEIDIVPDNEGGKAALRTAAFIAVAVAASYLGPAAGAAFFGGSKLAIAATSVGISVAGSLAINALVPPPNAALVPNTSSNLTRDYAVTGSSNNYTPYAPFPKIFGKHRIFPPKASLEYTELVGNEQYLNSLFCIGYGPLTITEPKIGEQDIAQFGDAIYQVGTSSNPPTLFPSLVDEQQLNILLDKVAFPSIGAWTTINSEPNTRKLSVDVFMPVLAGPYAAHWVDFFVEVSRDGGAWVDVLDPASGYDVTVVNAEHAYLGGVIYGEWVMRAYKDGAGSKRAGIYFNTPASDSYRVRVARRGDTSGGLGVISPLVVDNAYLSAVRSFINDNVIKTTDSTIVYIATRLRASDKLNGVIENFNCVAQAQHPVWNGSSWNLEDTRNPAWAFADLLTGFAVPNPISKDRLNASELLEWANSNITEGFNFDLVLTKKVVIGELANQLCSVGRATPIIKDGLHTVVVDKVQTIPSQTFTSRNSWGFQGSKIFTERIHGFKLDFINKDSGYQVDEVIAYDDGYSVSNATKFDKLPLSGVTDSDHAWKLGRYHMAVNRLRPETYEINTDIENIRCTRGDLIYLNYDVILVGLGSARIKTISLGTPSGGNVDFTLTIDDKKSLESTETYAINVRTNSGTIYTIVIDTPSVSEVDTDTITGTTTETIANAMVVGNLFQFGESGSVHDEMIVRFIEPGKDLTAKLTLVHYNSAILDADQGTIPTFNSNITNPADPTSFVPVVPNINQITSDETVIIVQANGSLVSRIVVNFNIQQSGSSVMPTILQTQYKPAGSVDGGWLDIPEVPANSGVVSISNVNDGAQYEIRIRFISPYGVPSEWVEITHTVIGKTGPPADVTSFSAAFVDNQVELRWDANTDPDIKDYSLSYGTVAGDNPLGNTDTTTFRTPALWAGSRVFWIIANDTSGNTSTAVSTTLVNIIPSITSFTKEVIDNNVILRWVNAASSLPVVSNEIRRGAVYATPTKTIGQKTGSFTSFFEAIKGTYTYWVTATDSAGNVSIPVSIEVAVDEPPDFILYTNIFKGFADGDLYTNCFAQEVDDSLYIPVNIAETWTQHFVNNSNTSFQDFIDDGYNTYTEPSLTTGEYNEEFDVGAVISSANINSLIDKTDVGLGTITLETYIEYKKLPGDSWTTNGNTTTILATNFQYIRMRYVVTSSDDKTYTILNKQTIDISVKEKTDSDNGSYTAGFGLTSDETNDYYASAANSASLNITSSVSIMGWLKIPASTVTSTTNLAHKTSYGLRYDGTNKQISGGGSQGYTTWDVPTALHGHWVHVIDVITSGAHKLYINGVEEDSQTGYTPNSSTNLLYVLGDGSTNGCPGSMSDVRVYAGGLTPAEALEMYGDNTATPAATLAAQWDFTEGTGTTTADTSGNVNTITLSSASMWDDDQGSIVFFNKDFVDIVSITPGAVLDLSNPTTLMYDFADIPDPEYFHMLPYNSITGVRKSSSFSWSCRGV